MRFSFSRALVCLTVLSLVVWTACGEPPPTTRDAPAAAQRVVAISLRGASHADFLRHVGELGQESALARLVEDGALSVLRPIANAETFPAMATFESGAWPAQHGVVGNAYHEAGDPISRPTIAYSDAVLTSETLWEAAQRQGKKVIRLGTLLPRGSRSGAAAEEAPTARVLPQAEQLGFGRVVEMQPDPGGAPWSRGGYGVGAQSDGADASRITPLAPDPEAPPLAIEGQADPPFVFELNAFVVSGSGAGEEGGERFDRVILDDDRDLGNGVRAELRPGGWVPVAVSPGPASVFPAIGSWVKLLDLDPESGTARLYVRPAFRNRGSPSEFVATLEEVLGFAPGAPDYGSYSRGLIDAGTVFEEIEREVAYLSEALLFALDHLDFDLLLVDYPVFDRVGHPFHVVDPRQRGWQAGGVALSEDRWRRAYHLADAAFATISARLDYAAGTRPTVLAATSEYGFFPAHTRIAINRLLADGGFVVGADDSAEVRAFVSSASAHVRVNPELVPAGELKETVERLADVLRQTRDPQTGEEIFDVIAPRSRLGRYHLDHPTRAGDLWVRLLQGYTFHGSADPDRALFDTPRFAGDHGYAPQATAAQGFFLINGLERSPNLAGEIEAVDVAVTLADLLDIEPPRGSRGRTVLDDIE